MRRLSGQTLRLAPHPMLLVGTKLANQVGLVIFGTTATIAPTPSPAKMGEKCLLVAILETSFTTQDVISCKYMTTSTPLLVHVMIITSWACLYICMCARVSMFPILEIWNPLARPKFNDTKSCYTTTKTPSPWPSRFKSIQKPLVVSEKDI